MLYSENYCYLKLLTKFDSHNLDFYVCWQILKKCLCKLKYFTHQGTLLQKKYESNFSISFTTFIKTLKNLTKIVSLKTRGSKTDVPGLGFNPWNVSIITDFVVDFFIENKLVGSLESWTAPILL